jgi:ATP-dependent RNA helicase DDX3X
MADSWGNTTTTDTCADGGVWGAAGEDTTEVKQAPPPLPFEHREAPIAEWEKKTAYNYQAYATGETEWASNAQVYHWDGEEGDIGPESLELEKILFGNEEDRAENEVIDFRG